VFQALRLWLNEEPQELDAALAWLPSAMIGGGVVVTLAYHSGEDRRIKHAEHVMTFNRPFRPSWRVPEGRVPRPEPWLLAVALVAVLLVEVWQNSHVAELCLTLDHNRTALARSRARLDFMRAEFERRTTRAELAPLAVTLGLAPAEARQIVRLPAEYLAASEPPSAPRAPSSLMAWAEQASRALVPEARAKSRIEN
jgi:hypothetical protein